MIKTKKTLAYWISAIFSPPVVASFLMLGYAAKIASSRTDFWYWGGVAFACTIALPSLVVIGGFLAGRYSDVHLERREDRFWPFVTAILGTLLALWILGQSNAPYYYIVLMVSVLVNLIVITLITLVWKISLHTATLSSVSVAAIYLFGWGALVSLVLIPPVMWSRMERKKHTPSQALGGILVAALVTTLIFYLSGFTPQGIGY